MTNRGLALVLTLGALAAGCQSARSDNDRAAELEKRVAELEQALQASPSPAPVAATPAASTQANANTGAPAPASRPKPKPKPRPAQKPAPAPVAPPEPEPVVVADTEPRPVVAEPERETRPRPRPVTVPAGTTLSLVLETPLSSEQSRVGDPVTARVQRATDPDGDVALPGGAVLRGQVIEVLQPGRVKGRARLAVAFDEIVVRGRSYGADTSALVVEAQGTGKRDAAIVGGAAVAGGVIGAIAGGKGGLGKGVLVGAGAGSGAVLATRGKAVDLPAGTTAAVTLRSRLVF